MKRICILLVIFGLAALGANAQTVTGSGTTNTIPQFTSSTSIGNSPIVEFNGNIGIGTPTARFPLDIFGGIGGPSSSFCCPILVLGELRDSTDGSIAVEGLNSALSGNTTGLAGISYSPTGNGVVGNGGGNGVRGQTNTVTGFAVGTAGVALGTSGPGVGIFGQAWSGHGVAGLFANVAGGDIIVGGVGQPEVSVFRVDGNGTVFANGGFRANVAAGTIIVGGVGQPEVNVFRVDDHGTVFADGGFRPFGADFAESIAVKGGTEHYAPGDLLVIDASGERRLSLSQSPYSTLVAGIYSTQPGVVASMHRVDEALPNNEVPLAVVGIVPCKVTAENGPIMAGDLLVTSSTPGHAMKGTDRGRMLGAVVGKALEPLQKGTGVIQVLVTLQ